MSEMLRSLLNRSHTADSPSVRSPAARSAIRVTGSMQPTGSSWGFLPSMAASAAPGAITVTTRRSCRVCGASHMMRYVHLPAMPLTDQLLTAEQLGQEFIHGVSIWFCPECKLSQTRHDVSSAGYYHDYGYSAAHSPFVREFMASLAQSVWRLGGLGPHDSVIEIGSGDGAQLECFRRLGARTMGIEPSEMLARESRRRGIDTHHGLFEPETLVRHAAHLLPAKIMLATYTFDHLPEPMAFLAAARQSLDPQRGLLILEVHDLEAILERHELPLFEHEHTLYCTAATLQRLLARAGFDLIATDLVPKAQRRGNSLLVAAAPRGSSYKPIRMLPLGPFGEHWMYESFGRSAQRRLLRFRAAIDDRLQTGRTLAAYGAGGRGVMSLAMAQRPGAFRYVCDRNRRFHGRFTPGAHVPVVSPDQLRTDTVDEVIVFSFGYFNEIQQDLKDYLQRGGRLTNALSLWSTAM